MGPPSGWWVWLRACVNILNGSGFASLAWRRVREVLDVPCLFFENVGIGNSSMFGVTSILLWGKVQLFGNLSVSFPFYHGIFGSIIKVDSVFLFFFFFLLTRAYTLYNNLGRHWEIQLSRFPLLCLFWCGVFYRHCVSFLDVNVICPIAIVRIRRVEEDYLIIVMMTAAACWESPFFVRCFTFAVTSLTTILQGRF